MTKRTAAIRLMACLLCLAPAGAGAAPAEVDAEAIIERCWAASREELNSDTPLRIGQGVSAVVACLEYQIVLLVEASQECAPRCGTAYNNVGGFYLAERLEGILRELAVANNKRTADVQQFLAGAPTTTALVQIPIGPDHRARLATGR